MPATHRPNAAALSLAAAVLGLLAVVLLVTPQASAASSKPCSTRLINDWYDGRIDNVYPARCYTRALEELPEDVDTYSSAREDINRALLAAIRQNGGQPLGPNDPVKPPAPRAGSGGGTTTGGVLGEGVDDEGGPLDPESVAAGGGNGGGNGPLDAFRPSSAESIPIPLIVLAGLALLLLAAAGVSFAARRIQARKAGAAPGPPQG